MLATERGGLCLNSGLQKDAADTRAHSGSRRLM
jgi:hypothetical protein